MPNCDFYGVSQDHEQLLDWLIRQKTCEIYELYSDYETPLRCFHTVDEVMSEFVRMHQSGNPRDSVHLQLNVLGAGPPLVPRRVLVDPKKCNGAAFRYVADGWGLVQLYLSGIGKDGIQNSSTNHASAKRAAAYAAANAQAHSAGSRDFRKVVAFSSRLNRRIRKMGVARIASRTVLPGALEAWERGVSLLPFTPSGSIQLVRSAA